VPTPVQADAHRLLGRLALDAQNFRRARRHYRTAIRLRPFYPEAYFGYALAVEADSEADARKERAALRRAVAINAGEPRYWTALGRACLRTGDPTAARRAFRRAARLRPDDVATLGEIVDGYLTLGRPDEAQAMLQAARFRCPRDIGLGCLWDRFRFDRLRTEQAAGRRAAPAAILAFPGRVGESTAAVRTPAILRADRASRPGPHLLRMGGFQAGPRQAR
jgi:Flp pilus assembly protein TadD